MVEYVKNIIIVGVAASLAVTALPKNAENAGRYVKQLSAFLILVVILSPLSKMSDIIFAVKNGIENLRLSTEEQTEDKAETDATEKAICSYIVELLHSEYSFDRDNTEVKLIFDVEDEKRVIREIQVFTTVGDSAYFAAAEKYIGELFGSEAHVFGVGVERGSLR